MCRQNLRIFSRIEKKKLLAKPTALDSKDLYTQFPRNNSHYNKPYLDFVMKQ